MLIRISDGESSAVISVCATPNDANAIMLNAKWVVTHMSSMQADMLLYDLRVAIPSLTIETVKAIINAYDPMASDKIKFFVDVCNIISGKNCKTFTIMPTTAFEI